MRRCIEQDCEETETRVEAQQVPSEGVELVCRDVPDDVGVSVMLSPGQARRLGWYLLEAAALTEQQQAKEEERLLLRKMEVA